MGLFGEPHAMCAADWFGENGGKSWQMDAGRRFCKIMEEKTRSAHGQQEANHRQRPHHQYGTSNYSTSVHTHTE